MKLFSGSQSRFKALGPVKHMAQCLTKTLGPARRMFPDPLRLLQTSPGRLSPLTFTFQVDSMPETVLED